MKEQQGTPEYLQVFEGLTRDIIQYGYKWGNPSPSAEPPLYKSLEDYAARSKLLLEVLGKWWGCATPNLYFYDRTREEADGQILWFHEVVDGGIDIPWLRISRGQPGDQTLKHDPVSPEEKLKLREKQRELRAHGRLTTSIVFRRFAEGRYKRSTSEETDGWILIPLGEILAYTFEWHLRQEAEAINKKQPGTDVIKYFSELNPTFVENAWEKMVQRLTKPGVGERYFRDKMLDWLDRIIADESEFGDWWKEWPGGNYDWFIAYARAAEARQPLRARLTSTPFPEALHELVRIIVKHWDYRHAEGKDQNSEKFLQRLRFSPEMEVEHFGTRNLVSFPLWLHWLRNGKETEDPQRTHAAFLMAGFYDAETARRYARNIQCVFLLLAQPYVARHSLPAMMLAKTGLLAESASYMFGQELSIVEGSTRLIQDDVGPLRGDPQSATSLTLDTQKLQRVQEAISNIQQSITRSTRIRNDLYWLPSKKSLFASATRRDRINMNQLLTEACDACSFEADKIRVAKTEMAGDLPFVNGDRATLRHVFIELLLNAKDAIKENITKAALDRRPVPDKWVTISTRRSDQDVMISISDTGIGMDNETASRIFQPFFTTKRTESYKGLGLGLWNAKLIIECHKGRIEARQTSPGQGTVMEIALPVAGRVVPPERGMS